MRFLLSLLFLSFCGQTLAQAPNTEITAGVGITTAELTGYTGYNNFLEQMVWAHPKPGSRFSLGMNFNLNQKPRHIYLSVGFRFTHATFATEERILRYRHDHHSLPSYYKEEDYSFKYTFFSVGVPIRLNYITAIGKQQKFMAGIGMLPSLQSGLEKPFMPCAEAYAGCLISARIALTLDAHRSFLTYPKSETLGIKGTYIVWGTMLEMRYRFNIH